MVFIFEGARSSGKSYLANHAPIQNYHFPTIKLQNTLKLSMKDVSLVKDTALLDIAGLMKQDVIIDRCFISTLVYGEYYKRFTEEEALAYVEWISSNVLREQLNVFRIVYIVGEDRERSRDDGYDNIDRQRELELFDKWLKYFSKYTIHFNNEYTQKSVDEMNIMLQKNIGGRQQ